VEAKVAQGVKESEVSYQMAFSKEQLRKVIGQYPAREVKRGLEHLYRKVEKHLSEDSNLLQVGFSRCITSKEPQKTLVTLGKMTNKRFICTELNSFDL